MELSEIQQVIKSFEAKLKSAEITASGPAVFVASPEVVASIKAKKKKIIKQPHPVIPDIEIPEPAVPVDIGAAAMPFGMCFTAAFKGLIVAITEDYIGKNDAKLWLLQQPDCVEVG